MSKKTSFTWVEIAALITELAEAQREQAECDRINYEHHEHNRKVENQNAALLQRVEELESALRELVQCNEEWNAAVESVIGRPAGWNAAYLDKAKKALAPTPEEK